MIFLFWKALKFGCRSEHSSYQTHSCLSASRKDVQVPVCPRCSEPVPTPRDVLPDFCARCAGQTFVSNTATQAITTAPEQPQTAVEPRPSHPSSGKPSKPSCSDNSAKHPFRCGNYRDHLGNHVGGRGADEGTDAFNAGRGRGPDEGASWQWLFGCRLSVPSTPN
ncbi:arsenite inducible RNA associated protein aip-1 [Culex quinquefasciatus]|uniref:Arsenite inducible RNA associated protein aip-1 n=1 Tax=Culex quinquefasciatus TaxID=7176 RepID=B0WYY8_CULQU|nr:arsenite inducible RNA associated protein aip-1 [Culex quinquefasciatus]|eukprot:XP_001862613.1 arsenite inducible RNA associated protein aip-1 [Culex quinquefasciatus]